MTVYANTKSLPLSSPVDREDGEGVDVTHRIGVDTNAELRGLYDRYRGAFQLSVSRPSVEHFRLCVDAFDDLMRAFREGE